MQVGVCGGFFRVKSTGVKVRAWVMEPLWANWPSLSGSCGDVVGKMEVCWVGVMSKEGEYEEVSGEGVLTWLIRSGVERGDSFTWEREAEEEH